MRSANIQLAELRGAYPRDGYAVARGLFSENEVADLRNHFMSLREAGAHPGDFVASDKARDDPLKRYPRMIHMHAWDETSFNWMLDERLTTIVRELVEGDVYVVQTMIYFKPPGARGQALHQDNFFISARPGNCIAAWLALDRSDIETGCLHVVPGSQNWPLLCTVDADLTESFTDVTIPLPEGVEAVPVEIEAGDVMFFHGCLVHGSQPNRTAHRFRRSLIAHYVDRKAREVSYHVSPAAYRLDGTPADLVGIDGGGPCGEWHDVDGTPVLEVTGIEPSGWRGRPSE